MPKKKSPSKSASSKVQSSGVPAFLSELLTARSPSGNEMETQAVVDRYMKGAATNYEKDRMGNRIATLNPKGCPTLMLAGHMDELGFQIKHVDDKGFIYFDTVGGHDPIMIPGRRVVIMSEKGEVKGVTGKRAIHLMSPEDRKKVPQVHEMWIDIGASSREEVLERVEIGDPVVYDMGVEPLYGSVATARGFDDKAGCYAVCETLRRLASQNTRLNAKVVSVATTQEEIGTRGAATSSYAVHPDLGVAVDVGHATDHPDCDPRKHGKQTLGGGPIIGRGPNINPFVFKRLVETAKAKKIPYQVESEPSPTPTDARVMQMAREGAAASILSIPLRYMHTPSECVDLNDIEHTVQLLVAFAQSLKTSDNGIW